MIYTAINGGLMTDGFRQKRAYAGIGARATPPDVCQLMTGYARRLEAIGYVLRSGHAVGADRAFEEGVLDAANKEIFLPKTSFPSDTALEIAASIHPAWHLCSEYARSCHGRNVYQILGETLDRPVQFVVCWTPNAEEVGGTRTAIVLAKQHSIPVYNLGGCVGRVDFSHYIGFLEQKHQQGV